MNRFLYLIVLIAFFIQPVIAQKELIEETDSIRIYDADIPKDFKNNFFPSKYKDGFIFINGNKTSYHHPFFTDLKNKPKKIRITSKVRLGGLAVLGNEIYFTGISKRMNILNEYNLTIYKGTLEDFKVTKIKELAYCNYKSMYAHPSISPSGKKMIIVSNEKERMHLLELIRDEEGEWVHGTTVYISHPSFDILSPTYLDEDTIYFSSNYKNGKIAKVNTEMKGDSLNVKSIDYETASYNIYRLKRRKGQWGVPIKQSVLSSEFDDFGILFTSEKTGYITSYRYDNIEDFYYFELKQ